MSTFYLKKHDKYIYLTIDLDYCYDFFSTVVENRKVIIQLRVTCSHFPSNTHSVLITIYKKRKKKLVMMFTNSHQQIFNLI